jgi:DNA-binding transcriptional LysR family regulator
MRGELGEYARGLKGHVRLLANTAAAAEILPEALATFLAGHPNVDIDLDERPSPDIARALAEGVADVGIAADHADFSGLEARFFRTDRLVLVVPRGHALSRRDEMRFCEALGSDFVGLAGDSALQRHLAEHAVRAGGRMRLRARLRSLDAVCRMVALGAGVAIVPEAAARRFSDTVGLVRLTDTWTNRRLCIVTRCTGDLPAHARSLIEHLASRAAQGC